MEPLGYGDSRVYVPVVPPYGALGSFLEGGFAPEPAVYIRGIDLYLLIWLILRGLIVVVLTVFVGIGATDVADG